MKSHLAWQGPEHNYTPKSRDWYTAVAIITVTMAGLALIFGNFIFAILIIVSSFTLCLHAAHPPKTIKFELTNKGVVVKDILYPYSSLESFWITETENPVLIIKSKKLLVPYIYLPMNDEDTDDARYILSAYLKEAEHQESLSQKIMERLGF